MAELPCFVWETGLITKLPKTGLNIRSLSRWEKPCLRIFLNENNTRILGNAVL